MKAFRFDTCSLERWYFVCDRCDAKWFSLQQQAACPRCRATAASTERIIPPWLLQESTPQPTEFKKGISQ